jgi:hypothetical protein
LGKSAISSERIANRHTFDQETSTNVDVAGDSKVDRESKKGKMRQWNYISGYGGGNY